MKPIKDKFILLFSPQPSMDGRRVIPLNLLAISSFLNEEGYDIRVFHSYDEKDYLEALKYLDRAICVGITTMTGYQICDGLKFAQLVRNKNANIPIVWGGIHVTIKPLQTMAHPLVDIVVKGQGEESFTEIVHCLDNNQDLNNVLGIAYKKDGNIINNPNRPYKNIVNFPPIPYQILDDTIERYIKENDYAKRNLIYISSFGCPFRCAFCCLSDPAFSGKWDYYPAERVIKEIEMLVKKYNLDGIELRDSNFFVDQNRTIKICHGLINKGVKVAISKINGRAEQMIRYSDSDWQLFKDVGIKEILIGAESGDQEILDMINKQSQVEDVLECEKKAKEFGINIINSFMTSFPNKMIGKKSRKRIKEELDKTVVLISKIFEINPMAIIFLFFYTPYPGTRLYNFAVKNGFYDPKELTEWCNIDLMNKTTPWTSKCHVKRVLFLRQLFFIKKITNKKYLESKTRLMYVVIKRFGLYQLINKIVTLRLRHNFYLFPIESYLLYLMRLIKK